MRFEELNWFDLEQYLLNDDRLMLVIGACEQHGYLSLLTDVKIPLALADAASQMTGVLVAPPLNFGSSPYFLDYPGTISLRLSTMLDVVEDVVKSLHGQGFRRILVLNGHGGNEGVRAKLYELINELSDLKISWFSWWMSHSIEAVARKFELKPSHANWLEAFSFTRVTELPKEKKGFPHLSCLSNAVETRKIYGDGVFGGEYSAANSVVEELFAAALDDILVHLKFE
jgi:creatinine amidohydrolase